VTQQEDYRTLTFNLLPSLVYLDGVDREGHEALSGSEEEGNSDVQNNADINLSATHTTSKFNGDPSVDILLLTTHVGGLGQSQPHCS